jgi:hypothetical protein
VGGPIGGAMVRELIRIAKTRLIETAAEKEKS